MDAGPSTSLTERPVTASRRRILARTRLDFWLDALVVAVIVGLGMLWAHTSGGTGIGHHEHAPPREVVLRMQQIKAGAIRVQSGNGVNLSDTSDLIRTCEIEAALAALVIAVSVVRRRHRRTRRTAVHGSG